MIALVLALAGALPVASWYGAAGAKPFEIKSDRGGSLHAEPVAIFKRPWAMTFLPDGQMLVTTKPGSLFLVTQDGQKTKIAGIWKVAHGGQGGLGDVMLHPHFAHNNLVYVSYVEQSESNGGHYGAVVVRAKLDRSGSLPKLVNVDRIWEQTPKTAGRRHFGHRLAFGPDGKLFISSGDRGNRDRVQRFDVAFGKIIRLNEDGSLPPDNPWQDNGELARSFWSIGHRNPLGLTFDTQGRLWSHEMGPRHGDELNLILKGRNYGWPIVSNGNHYSGAEIPNHDTSSDYEPPKAFWVPAISPGGLLVYDGKLFPKWRANAFLAGLSGRALVRVEINGARTREAERFEWDERVREVEQGPEGAIWALEDGSSGRLLKLIPSDQ